MSQKEFDQMDREVIALVAGRAHPAAEVAARQIASAMWRPRFDDRDAERKAAQVRKDILLLAIQVLSCFLAALIFITALFLPEIVVHLTNVGVLVAGIVAAVKIDRHLREEKRHGHK